MRNTKEFRELITKKIRELLKDSFIGQDREPIKKGMVVATIGFVNFVPDGARKAKRDDLKKGIFKFDFVFYNEGSLFLVIDEPVKENHQAHVLCLTSGHTGWIDTQSLKAYE